MFTINATNVNDAYVQGMLLLQARGIPRQTRNGSVVVCPEPVTTHYARPYQRVLFDPARDANPFFHLFEALWMLSGANDVDVPSYFVNRMRQFSDDGTTFHAAYGHRWNQFSQLENTIAALQSDPNTRRAIITLWDPTQDSAAFQGNDFPCNTTIKFERVQDPGGLESLNMIVFNRSNDIIWGCYGANAVHFSILQEYVAQRLHVSIGWYEQVSCDFHAYTNGDPRNDFNIAYAQLPQQHILDPYALRQGQGNRTAPVRPEPLLPDWRGDTAFHLELDNILEEIRRASNSSPTYLMVLASKHLADVPALGFFYRVVYPMLIAFESHKRKLTINGVATLARAIEEHGRIDWLVAGHQWLSRRIK